MPDFESFIIPPHFYWLWKVKFSFKNFARLSVIYIYFCWKSECLYKHESSALFDIVISAQMAGVLTEFVPWCVDRTHIFHSIENVVIYLTLIASTFVSWLDMLDKVWFFFSFVITPIALMNFNFLNGLYVPFSILLFILTMSLIPLVWAGVELVPQFILSWYFQYIFFYGK